MVVYNFKTIITVPTSKDFIDIVLSKTQRKTPTVCHKGWYIQRLRDFYERKIKFTGESFKEKLTQILEGFPRLDDIHPYYSDLINVLYSKHHYKLALGQLSTAKTLIENIAKDYLRLIKFAESQYRCKELKRAALGRMAKIAKKLNTSLGYLERVRQHLSRLPSLDPTTRTIVITGFPNVGKSSFINKVSKADVDVQPYAFTTKSIFVGHFYYKDLPWQVVDTPGILDHSLEERNIIEMQAVTALAHLNATVLFFVDISETCGYTIKKQAALYQNIKALFSNKPLLVVANKIDLKAIADLDDEDKQLIEAIAADRNTQIIPMSNVSEIGVSQVKATACDMLLRQRCEKRLQTNKVDNIANRLNITMPQPRDNKKRGVSIPENIVARNEEEKRARSILEKNLRDEGLLDDDSIRSTINKQILDSRVGTSTVAELEAENGGAGAWSFDRRNYLLLDDDEWKFDVAPEFMDGKNVADFYDPEIAERLAELEREEEELEAAFEESGITVDNSEDELTEEQYLLLQKIRNKKMVLKSSSRLKEGNASRAAVRPRTTMMPALDTQEKILQDIGLDTSKYRDRVLQVSRSRKRTRDTEDMDEMDEVSERRVKEVPSKLRQSSQIREISRMRTQSSHARSQSRMRGSAPELGDGFKTYEDKERAEKREKQVWKRQHRLAQASESDRRILNEMPKHLFSGKRGMGKTDRR